MTGTIAGAVEGEPVGDTLGDVAGVAEAGGVMVPVTEMFPWLPVSWLRSRLPLT